MTNTPGGTGGIVGARTRLARYAALIVVGCLASMLGWALTTVLATSPTVAPGTATVLRVGWTDDPESLNPFVGQTGTALEIYALNYDFLTRYDAETLTSKPGLATTWSHSPDGKTWTFTLRRGVTWQDGRPFSSKDVVFTFDYVIKNKMGAFTGYTTFIERVVAVDPYTVRFVCSRPKANMLELAVPILPEHIWSHIDPKVAADTYRNKPPVIGTGPFQVVEYRPNKYVRLVANKQYWRGAPKVDELILQIYQSPDTMQMDLRSGAIQAATKLPLAQLKTLQTDEDLDLSTQNPQLVVHDLGFNCYTGPASQGNPVLLDPAFRRALNYAIDKEQICRVAYFGLARPGETTLVSQYWVDPDWHWTPPAGERYPFDLEKAKTALDAAGYRDTDGDGLREFEGKPITLRLWAIATEPNEQTAGKLITGWLRQVGLEDEVRGPRHRRPHGPHVEQEGQAVRARLRSLPVGLEQRARSQLHALGVHHERDRELERHELVERGVRPSLRRTAGDDRSREAQADRRPHAAADVRTDADDLPRRAVAHQRVERGEVGGLGPCAGRRGRGGGSASDHRQLPLCAASHGPAPAQPGMRWDGLAIAGVVVAVGAVVLVARRARMRPGEETEA